VYRGTGRKTTWPDVRHKQRTSKKRQGWKLSGRLIDNSGKAQNWSPNRRKLVKVDGKNWGVARRSN